MRSTPALLALADGSLWYGKALGALGERTGEVVFNTGLTGYQEILTDPSYYQQIVVMTQPHIGNYGTHPADDESDRCWATGFVVRAISPVVSNWRSQQSLPDYLTERGVVAITDVDTRALVRHIRDNGAMRAAISSVNLDPARLVAMAQAAPDMSGWDLTGAVSCAAPYHWEENSETEWQYGDLAQVSRVPVSARYKVVAYDFGIKRNILRLLSDHGCQVTVVPANTSAEQVLALEPDGIFLSNGPGDPAAATTAIANIRQLLGKKPIFGICLGHQLLGLALGAHTYKLKFGHRGSNQPVLPVDSNTVQISSHNHGFAIDAKSLPEGVAVSHFNLNDQCVEGLAVPGLKAFSIQYHPEAAPGPYDARTEFAKFIALMAA
jgi:carbamoyl-phosphate synthase small subunit